MPLNIVASGISVALGLPPEAIAAGAAACPQVPGRVERIDAGDAEAPTVLVDYAHTPDAVEKVLRTLRPVTKGRLIAVFGCGGDRDRAKRPLMAEAVARWADAVIATSDNPRTEDPVAILADVERGLGKLLRVEPDALDAAVNATVQELLAGGPAAQAEIKQLFAQLAVGPITPEVRELTAQTISRVRGTDEAREGFAAFLGKRPPSWASEE